MGEKQGGMQVETALEPSWAPRGSYAPAAALAVTVVLLSVAFDRVMQPFPQRLHLGAEYFNVARALADGRGFSDPFGEHTGPTAWMPPVYPALLALILRVVASKNELATVTTILMTASLIVQGVTVQLIARRCLARISPWVASGVFLLWVVTFHYWFFVLTSDVWLLSLFVNFLTLGVAHHVTTGRVTWWAWGLLGGLGVLASPTFGVAWGCLVLLLLWREPGRRRSWLAAIALAGAVASPWLARNAVVFRELIPTKSNLPFEAYQANVLDSDGVYDISSMLEHPYNSERLRFDYQRLGEIAFVQRFGESFKKQLRARPHSVLRRVRNRAYAATLNYVPLSANMDRPAWSAVLHGVYAMPFLTLVIAGWINGPQRRLQRTLALFWACYLLPYVVVAFYIRYLLPLTPLLVVSVLVGADQLAWLASRARAKSTARHGRTQATGLSAAP